MITKEVQIKKRELKPTERYIELLKLGYDPRIASDLATAIKSVERRLPDRIGKGNFFINSASRYNLRQEELEALVKYYSINPLDLEDRDIQRLTEIILKRGEGLIEQVLYSEPISWELREYVINEAFYRDKIGRRRVKSFKTLIDLLQKVRLISENSSHTDFLRNPNMDRETRLKFLRRLIQDYSRESYRIEIIQNGLNNGTYISPENFENIDFLLDAGICPTERLVKEIQENSLTPQSLEEKIRKIEQGGFDPSDELMVHIEYTNFMNNMRRVHSEVKDFYWYFRQVQEKAKKGIKERTRESMARINTDLERDELEYLCIEADYLLEMIMRLKDKARTGVIVVSNFSYGDIAISPIRQRLREEGIKIIQTKVSSSKSHSKPFVLQENTLSRNELQEILHDQPQIVVVDGTTSVGNGRNRYPDSLQGFLNYAILLNDIITQNQSKEYSEEMDVSEKHIARLRETRDYSKEKIRIGRTNHTVITPYAVKYWNPAGARLNISNCGDYNPKSRDCMNLRDVENPSIILVNTTMCGKDIPRSKRRGLCKHYPGYFDDKNGGLRLNYDNWGVYISSVYDEALRQIYNERHARTLGGTSQRRRLIPQLAKF